MRVPSLGELSEADIETVVDHDRGCDSATNGSVKQEHQEVLVIVKSNTVADPRTVMIEPGYTLAADRAVMRTGWPEALTLSAVSPV